MKCPWSQPAKNYKPDLERCQSSNADLLREVEDLKGKLKASQSLLTLPFERSQPINKDGDWIDTVLDQIPNWQIGIRRIPLDSKYYLAPAVEVQSFITWDWVNTRTYLAEFFDCENFAFWFKARFDGIMQRNQVGLIVDWSGGHAYNCIVLPDGALWIYEPQNDEHHLIQDHKHEGLYKLESGVILI